MAQIFPSVAKSWKQEASKVQEKQSHLGAEVADLEARTRWDAIVRTQGSEEEGF